MTRISVQTLDDVDSRVAIAEFAPGDLPAVPNIGDEITFLEAREIVSKRVAGRDFSFVANDLSITLFY